MGEIRVVRNAQPLKRVVTMRMMNQVRMRREPNIMLTSNWKDPSNNNAVCWDDGGRLEISKVKMLPCKMLNTASYDVECRMPLGSGPDQKCRVRGIG